MKLRLLTLLVILAAVSVALAVTVKEYVVRDKLSGSSVLWSADRCVVVVGVDTYGHHTNLLGSVLDNLRARLNLPGARPDDRSSAVTVFTITSAGVSVRQVPLPYSDFEVMDGTLYSRLGGYGQALWRWTGVTFERATVDQEAALSRAHAPIEFDNRNGWSKRFDPFHRGDHTELRVHADQLAATLLFEYDGAATYTLKLVDGRDRKVLIAVGERRDLLMRSTYASLMGSGPGMGRGRKP